MAKARSPLSVFLREVRRDPALSSDAKLVITVIAMFSREDRPCDASDETFADECGMSLRGLQRALKEARETGYVDASGGRRYRVLSTFHSAIYSAILSATQSANVGGKNENPSIYPESIRGKERDSAPAHVREGDEPRDEDRPAARRETFSYTLDEVLTAAGTQGVGELDATAFFHHYATEDPERCAPRRHLKSALALWKLNGHKYGSLDAAKRDAGAAAAGTHRRAPWQNDPGISPGQTSEARGNMDRMALRDLEARGVLTEAAAAMEASLDGRPLADAFERMERAPPGAPPGTYYRRRPPTAPLRPRHATPALA